MFKAPGREDASLVDRLGARRLSVALCAWKVMHWVAIVGVSATVLRPAAYPHGILGMGIATRKIRPPAGRASICMAATVGVSSPDYRAYSLLWGGSELGRSFARRAKFMLARPLTTRLCFSCYVWRDFAGIYRPPPALNGARVIRFCSIEMPPTSAALEHFTQLALGPLQHTQPAFGQVFASPVDVECQHRHS
jgi:hypothetical protein